MVSELCLMCGSTLNCQTLCLGARPRYSLFVDEDVKKPTNQTKSNQSSSSATGLFRGQVQRLKSEKFTCYHTRDRAGDHDFCLSQSYYTDTYPSSRERARGSNPWPPNQELRDLHTELPPPPPRPRPNTHRKTEEMVWP